VDVALTTIVFVKYDTWLRKAKVDYASKV
jgi:hypothetical protein